MSDMKFCYLKGEVTCNEGRVQDCNNQRVKVCMLETAVENEQSFCFLKGLVDCPPSRVQDCNMKRLNKCMLEE